MESQVPGGVPGVFPGIGHDDDIEVTEVPPVFIATALRGWWWPGRISPEPDIHIIVEELLAPEQASQRLTLHHTLIICPGSTDCTVKLICFSNTCRERFLGIGKWRTLLIG